MHSGSRCGCGDLPTSAWTVCLGRWMEVYLMPKQSGFLQRQREREDEALLMGINIGVQYAIDTLNISLHEADGWAYDRQMRLMEVWKDNRQYYKDALDYRKPEADVYRDKLDKGLITVIGGKAELIPFPERYPDLRPVRYDRRR
nr:MAG TPA: hypothetical protein [Caudoviricetes sp.]